MQFIVSVHVVQKPEVPNPVAKEIVRKAAAIGVELASARSGKYFEIRIDRPSEEAARASVEDMCKTLLTNPYIEEYEIVSIRKD